MTRRLIIPVLLLSLLVENLAFSADYQKGLDAYKSGDYATALREFRPLAKQGIARVQFYLGVLHEKGLGGPANNTAAIEWYTRAVEHGDSFAQNNLGLLYKKGLGVGKNFKFALKFFSLSADQGHAPAQLNLGVMYDEGLGVPQNDKTAVKWYRLAAEQRYAKSQFNLGAMYQKGRGVTQDYVRAHMWWNIATLQGDKDAREKRDTLEKILTSTQLETAQKLARECFQKNYKGC